MSSEVIQDFRAGLDVRKFKLNSPAGTLKVAVNGHITPGGEIEKRKAFVKGAFTGTCFGLVPISTGLVTFGSASAPGGFPQTLFGLPVTYQRLQHPDGSTAMTGVVDAKTFGDKTFVAAQFGSDTHTFYDGTVIPDFIAGLIVSRWVKSITSASRTGATVTVNATGHGLSAGNTVGISGMSVSSFNGTWIVLASGLTADVFKFTCTTSGTASATTGTLSNDSAIVAALVASVNATADYTAVDNANGTANLLGTSGRNFSSVVVLTSTAGAISIAEISTAGIGAQGAKPVGQFTVVAGMFDTGTLPDGGGTDYDQGFIQAVTVGGRDILNLGTWTTVYHQFNIATGLQTVSPAVMPPIGADGYADVGSLFKISNEDGTNLEYVRVVARTDTSFTAVFTSTKTTPNITIQIGGVNPVLTSGNVPSIYPQAYIPWQTTAQATAVLIVAAINALSTWTGYSAVAHDGTVLIYGSAQTDAQNGAVVGATSTGSLCIENGSFSLAGSAFTITGLAIDGVAVISGPLTYANISTVSRYLTSNVATINVASQFGLKVGDTVVITGMALVTGVDVFNGTFVLTAVTATSISYAKTNANVNSAGSPGADTAGTIRTDTSLTNFYNRIVRDICQTAAIPASTDGTKIYLQRAQTSKSDSADVTVTISYTGDLSVNGGKAVSLSATVSPPALNAGFNLNEITTAAIVRVKGGVGPYQYKWIFFDNAFGEAGVTPSVVPTNTDEAYTTFKVMDSALYDYKKKAIGATVYRYICRVTDSLGASVYSSIITITLVPLKAPPVTK